jgi:hypothetical protein
MSSSNNQRNNRNNTNNSASSGSSSHNQRSGNGNNNNYDRPQVFKPRSSNNNRPRNTTNDDENNNNNNNNSYRQHQQSLQQDNQRDRDQQVKLQNQQKNEYQKTVEAKQKQSGNDEKSNKSSPRQSSERDTQNKNPNNNNRKNSSNRRKLLSTSSNSGLACSCCLNDLYCFVYYSCSHFVCLNCSLKMRVLCDKIDCPVCRQESKFVLCTSSKLLREEETPQNINSKINKLEKLKKGTNVGFYFEDERILMEYDDILANICDICNYKANNFDQLSTHIRKQHSRFYCDLCLNHLKLFPYERKHYSREQLAAHKRLGDVGDTSFKPHPICKLIPFS